MKEKIIKLLSNKNTTVLNSIQINDLLNLNTTTEYQELLRTLDKLSQEGILYHSNKDKYLLFENSHLIKGKLQLKEKGFGFLIETGLDKDIYINKDDINNAYDGDTVAVEITDKIKNEGRIVKILKRNEKSIIGEVYVVKDKYYIKPDKKNLPILELENAKEKGVVDGHKIMVRRNKNKAIITDIIGHKNDPNIDMLSIIYEHDFRPDFPKEVIDSLDQIPSEVKESEMEGRIDLRDELIFTIDGADTKDIDDAISVKKNKDQTYELGVHIANVSYYVKKGSILDLEAYNRATSVYLTDRVLPMLPQKLSNGICSLNPEVDRLAFSCVMTIDNQGRIINKNIFKSIIKSKKQMTYEAVNKILEENTIVEGYEKFIDNLKLAKELSDILRKKMINRGYIDFDTKEVKIIVDENNHPIDIKLREQKTGEKIIENFMIAANEAVAEYIYYKKLPGIYRVHDEPAEKKVDMFFDFLKAKSIVVTGKRHGKTTVKDYQNILEQLKDNEAAMVFKEMLVRSMAKAIYSDKNIGHFGLGSKCYSHFTSPIRRYPDLTLHRLLDTYLDNYDEEIIENWQRELPTIAQHCSIKERDADECEYDVEDMKMAEYMQDHIGQVYDGVISGVKSFGVFVTILENGVEGLIKTTDLGEENFIYYEKEQALVGQNSKKKYSLGDKIKINVLRASKEERTIDFKLEDGKCQKRVKIKK